ncbi:MAG: copper amine oxidase N-terminal domain-containing protein [Armatimonadota bacterium]
MRYWLLLLLLTASLAALAQGGIALPAEVYSTPGPHVVVNGVLLQAPVQKMGGSLLLPMRAVFEALQAQVRWYPAAQQIIAIRGATTVQLWINKPVAIVNEQEITLATPPALAAGTTYVPLRFPAEAFGGEVKWFGNLQTAVITITPLPAAAPAPTPTPTPAPTPAPTPTPEPATLDGVLVTKVIAGATTALLVQLPRGDTELVQLAQGVAITRANGSQPAQAATFAALEPGDQLRMTRDAAGKATAVAARFAQVKGTTAAIANNKLLLQDGSLYQLTADIRVVDAAGQAVPLAQVTNGVAVTLDLTPDTTNVWRITVPVQVAAPPPAPALRAPGILTVAAAGYTRPLKAGDTLTIQVTGEPKADRVTASVGDILRDLVLDETAPGTYTRKVTIAANTNATDAAISAVMRLNLQDSAVVKSAQPVTIDTRPPSFDALIPGDGTTLVNRNPTLEAAYADPGGSGVDAKSVKILVNGTDVTKLAIVTDGRLSYKAQELPLGAVIVRIELADLAGNTAAADWKMTSPKRAPPPPST